MTYSQSLLILPNGLYGSKKEKALQKLCLIALLISFSIAFICKHCNYFWRGRSRQNLGLFSETFIKLHFEENSPSTKLHCEKTAFSQNFTV